MLTYFSQAPADMPVSLANPNEPLRPRVVATGDVDVLNLLWSSKNSNKPVLKWGIVKGGMLSYKHDMYSYLILYIYFCVCFLV